MVNWNDAFWFFLHRLLIFSFSPLHSRLIWRTFLTWVISVYIYSSKETKKDKKGSKYQDIKNNLAAAIVQIKRSEELNKKCEREYQETLAAMQRRIQELEGRNPFSFIEFHNVNEMSPIWEPFFGGVGG